MSSPLVTETAVRSAVVAEALKDLGYQGPVGGWNKWAAWYGSAWTNAYFCAAGWSWCWNKALGEAAARSVIGRQSHGGDAPNNRGFIWTVAILVQHRHRAVALRLLKPGDALMSKYHTGDPRAGNETNHVDLVEANFPDQGYMVVIGYNVPRPGATTGDPSRGGGVWRRRVYYNNPFIVAGLQMPAASLASVIRGTWSTIQRHLTTLRLADLQGTGDVGPATLAGVAAYAKTYGYTGAHDDHTALLAHLEDTIMNIAEALAALAKSSEALNSQVDRRLNDLDNTIRAQAKRLLETSEFPAVPGASVADLLVGTNRTAHTIRGMLAAQQATDPAAVARIVVDELGPELVEAIKEAGGGASAKEVVDLLFDRVGKA